VVGQRDALGFADSFAAAAVGAEVGVDIEMK
jgi:hypothetical protein